MTHITDIQVGSAVEFTNEETAEVFTGVVIDIDPQNWQQYTSTPGRCARVRWDDRSAPSWMRTDNLREVAA